MTISIGSWKYCKLVEFPISKNRMIVIEVNSERQTINICATGSISLIDVEVLKKAIDIAVMIAMGKLEVKKEHGTKIGKGNK